LVEGACVFVMKHGDIGYFTLLLLNLSIWMKILAIN